MSLYIYWPLSHIAPGTEFTVKLQTSHMYFLWKERLFSMDFMKVWDTAAMFIHICLSKRPCQHIYKQECDIREIYICDLSRVLLSVIGQEYYYLWLVQSITLYDWSIVLLSGIGQEYYSLWMVKGINICDWSRVFLSVIGQ